MALTGILLVFILTGCISAKKEDAPGVVYTADELRNLEIYIITGQAEENRSRAVQELYDENMYIPQAVAAYYGIPFVIKNNQYAFDFSSQIMWRITSRKNIGDSPGVLLRVYQVEATGPGGSQKPGMYYTCSIKMDDADRIKQPFWIAMETCVKQSGAARGFARLDSMQFDSTSGKFTARVAVIAD